MRIIKIISRFVEEENAYWRGYAICHGFLSQQVKLSRFLSRVRCCLAAVTSLEPGEARAQVNKFSITTGVVAEAGVAG